MIGYELSIYRVCDILAFDFGGDNLKRWILFVGGLRFLGVQPRSLGGLFLQKQKAEDIADTRLGDYPGNNRRLCVSGLHSVRWGGETLMPPKETSEANL